MVCVSLKSKRVVTSRRAWSSALVSSAGSNSETTSKENSATRVKDCVDAGIDGGRREHNADDRRHDEQRSDAGCALVKSLEGRLVVGVRTEVEVVNALNPRPCHQVVEHGLATRRQRLGGQVGDRLLSVVARSG